MSLKNELETITKCRTELTNGNIKAQECDIDELAVKIKNQNWNNFSFSSTTEAFNKLASDSKSLINKNDVILVHVKITIEICEKNWDGLFARICNEGKRIVAVFEHPNTTSCMIVWKLYPKESYRVLNLSKYNRHVISSCKVLLADEIRNWNTGTLESFMDRHNLKVYEIANKKKQNCLINAVKENIPELVSELIKCNFNIDHEDEDEWNAMYHAWENYITYSDGAKEKSDKIILMLLRANSKYPEIDFNCNELSDEVKKFLDESEILHRLVKEKEMVQLKQELDNLPNLRRFYNRDNVSLMKSAIINYDKDIYHLLCSRWISFGDHEDIEKYFKVIRNSEKDGIPEILTEIGSFNKQNALKLPEAHIHTILSKIEYGNNCIDQIELKYDEVKNALEILDRNEACSKILQVVAIYKNLNIFVDFENYAINYIKPDVSDMTLGLASTDGSIYIGAKKLMNVNKKYDVIGTLIHEFCHLAMHLTFRNSFNPYPMSDSDERKKISEKSDQEKYADAVKECEKNKDSEPLIAGIFNYPVNQQHWEFIVRVMQIVIKYYNNSEKLNKLANEKFPLLFDYFNNVIKQALSDALEPLRKIFDEKLTISYADLTEPMKRRVLHKNIIFQGIETTMFKMIGENISVLNLCSPTQIRNFLSKDETKFCAKTSIIANCSAMERNFINFTTNYASEVDVCETVDDIIKSMKYKKIFLLADDAGAGKTIAFKDIARKLKKTKSDFFVGIIYLEDQFEVLEKWQNKNVTDIGKVKELLVEIFNLKSEMEKALFKELFEKSKVILLFDGVDKICSDSIKLLIKIMNILRNSTQNWQLISIRSYKKEYLESELKIKAHKFARFSFKELNHLFYNFLETENPKKPDEIAWLFGLFDIFEYRKNKKAYYFNNSSMIEAVVAFYSNDYSKVDPENVNLFEIFKHLFEEHLCQINTEILFKYETSLGSFTPKRIHEMYAFKSTFGVQQQELNEVLYEEFIEHGGNWVGERTKWKSDDIQCFGYLEVNLENQNDDIRFIHKTFSDFLITMFIIRYLFDTQKQIRDEEFKKVVCVLRKIGNSMDYEVIQKTLLDYLQTKAANNQRTKLFEGSKIAIVNEIEVIRNDICQLKLRHCDNSFINQLELWSTILLKDPDVLKKLWQVNSEEDLIQKVLLKKPYIPQYFIKFLNIISISFGKDWYKSFVDPPGYTINEEILSDIEIFENDHCKGFNRNLLNLLPLVRDKFNDKRTIYVRYFTDPSVLEHVSFEIVKIFLGEASAIFINNEEILIEILILFLNYSSDEEILQHIGESIENILGGCRDSIRKVLFCNNKSFKPPFIVSLMSRSKKVIQIFKKLFIKFKDSNQELEDFILDCFDIFEIFLHVTNSNHTEVENFLRDIFNENISNILQSTREEYTDSKISLICSPKFELFEKFMLKANWESEKIRRVLFSPSRHDSGVGPNSVKSSLASHPILIKIKSGNADEFIRVSKLYMKYKISHEELRNILINDSKLPQIFLYMNKELNTHFITFMKEIFAENKNDIFKCIGNNSSDKFDLIMNGKKFKFFEEFTKDFYNGNEKQVKKLIQMIINPNEGFPKNCNPLKMGNSIIEKESERIKNIYDKYGKNAFLNIITSAVILPLSKHLVNELWGAVSSY